MEDVKRSFSNLLNFFPPIALMSRCSEVGLSGVSLRVHLVSRRSDSKAAEHWFTAPSLCSHSQARAWASFLVLLMEEQAIFVCEMDNFSEKLILSSATGQPAHEPMWTPACTDWCQHSDPKSKEHLNDLASCRITRYPHRHPLHRWPSGRQTGGILFWHFALWHLWAFKAL